MRSTVRETEWVSARSRVMACKGVWGNMEWICWACKGKEGSAAQYITSLECYTYGLTSLCSCATLFPTHRGSSSWWTSREKVGSQLAMEAPLKCSSQLRCLLTVLCSLLRTLILRWAGRPSPPSSPSSSSSSLAPRWRSSLKERLHVR